jgi:hypothetical protein
MALVFPGSPTTGQIYQGWQWDGAKWLQLAKGSVLIQEAAASNVASVVISLPSGFRSYRLAIRGMEPLTTPTQPQIQASLNGGTSWIANYAYIGWYASGGATPSGGVFSNGGTATFLPLSAGTQAVAVGNPTFMDVLIDPGGASRYNSMLIRSMSSGTSILWQDISGWANTVGLVNAVRLLYAGVNMNISGYELYGWN